MTDTPKNLQQFIRQSGETRFKMEIVAIEDEFIELEIYPEYVPDNKFKAVIEANELHSAILYQFKRIMMKHIKKPGKFNSKNLYAGSKASLDKHRT
jgi:hypothetical protein